MLWHMFFSEFRGDYFSFVIFIGFELTSKKDEMLVAGAEGGLVEHVQIACNAAQDMFFSSGVASFIFYVESWWPSTA